MNGSSKRHFFGTNIIEPVCDSSCFLFFTETVTEIYVSMEEPDIKATQNTELIQGGQLPWRVLWIHIDLCINYVFILLMPIRYWSQLDSYLENP